MKPKSKRRGTGTLAVEVTNVSPNGIWLLYDETERFLPFRDFPWFEHASIAQIANVERPALHHLHWPELDVDLATESVEKPKRFPLVSRVRSGVRIARPARPRR